MNRSFETCHPYGEAGFEARVEGIQDRHFAFMTRAGGAAVAMLDAVSAVRKRFDDAAWREALAKDQSVHELGELERAAQSRLDFVAAENSMGFHAPQEMARILGESTDLSRQAQVKAVSLLCGAIPAPRAPEPPR